MTKHTIKLGNKYEDKIHGLTGTATAITEYLTGCTQVCLEYLSGGDIKISWFDVTAIKDVALKPKEKKAGGPGKHAPPKSRA